MKKAFMFVLIIIIFVNLSHPVYSEYDENPLGINNDEYRSIIQGEYGNSVLKLSELEIVRNGQERWQKEDFISRRNAFEMAYIIFNYGSRFLCTKSEIQNYEKTLKDDRLCYDVDLGTYDNALVYSLKSNTSLFYGAINEDKQCMANFDNDLTYNEAFAIVARLFARERRNYGNVKDTLNGSGGAYVYYDLMCDMGLINSNTILSYASLSVKKEEINKRITAYEFMHLLHNSLYIPHLASNDYGIRMYGFRYIEALDWFESIDSDEILDDAYYIP